MYCVYSFRSILYWKKRCFVMGLHTKIYTTIKRHNILEFFHTKPFYFSLVHIAQYKKEIDFIFAEGNLSDDF